MKLLAVIVFLMLVGCSSGDPEPIDGELTLVELEPDEEFSNNQPSNTPVIDPTLDESTGAESGDADSSEADSTDADSTDDGSESEPGESAETDLLDPELIEPEPTEPEPTEPEPTEPEPTESEPTEPESTEPESTESESTEPESTESEPTDPETSGEGLPLNDDVPPSIEGENDPSEGGVLTTEPRWLLSSEQGAVVYAESVVPAASDSVLRPSVFSFPDAVLLSDGESSMARVELAFSTSTELSALLISSDQTSGHWSLPLTARSETPFPDSALNTQAIYYDIDVETRVGDDLCLWFQAVDSEALISEKFETCFVLPMVSETSDTRVLRYFDRQLINEQPTTTLHSLNLDSLIVNREVLGIEPRQSLVVSNDRFYAVDANRFFEIDPVTGENTSLVNQTLTAYTSTGALNEMAYLLDHQGNVSRFNTELGTTAELLTRIPWKVLSFGNLMYRESDQLLYSTVRFKDPDNDFLFSIDPQSGDYEIVGVTGIRDICQLTISREQLFALGCDGSLSIIDPESGETAPLHETDAVRNDWLPSIARTRYTGSELQFPARGVDWRYWGGSEFHRPTYHSGRSFDDSHAYDLSKDGDVENLIAVTPIAPGDVLSSLDRIGFVLVRHDGALVLDDGSVHPVWYSGYMHLSEHSMPISQISTDYVLGYLSDVGTTNNHLHFAIYVPELTPNGETLVSIDIGSQLKDFVIPIHQWIDGCSWPIRTSYHDFRWWANGDLPCPVVDNS